MQKNRRMNNEAEMLVFGAKLAKTLSAGDVIALSGDLGAGKTTLARGIIQSLCGDMEVPSPTYTIVQTYDAPDFEIWHCDLYRLKTPDDIYELGLLDAMDEAVCLIEWPDRMGVLLPKTALGLDISFDGEGRSLNLSGLAEWEKRLVHV